MMLYYRLRMKLRARRIAAREAAIRAEWLRVRPPYATRGDFADFRLRLLRRR